MKNFIENILERSMFASRWVLSPIYVVLSLTLFVIMIKVIQEFIHEMVHILEMSINELLVFVLHIVDLALIGNLILIVLFSGLKLKLIASIVAISSIGLLEAFIDVGSKSKDEIYLMIYIHAIFILSGVFIAVMDYIASKTVSHYE